MIYPNFLSKGDSIGVSAPSDGITKPGKVKRLDFAITHFLEQGFKVIETNSVRSSIKGVSNTKEKRAEELLSLYKNKDIKAIICAAGGDFLLEILPFIDFDIIKNNIKWLQGYSDPTGLLFVITTNYDIATIYGNNFAAFGMKKWHKSLEDNIKILKGNIVTQNSFDKYESGYHDYILGDEEYVLDEYVCWNTLNNSDVKMGGRIIGGCIDILTDIFGTRFDNTKNFIEKYRDDGIIWYFDNCEQSMESLIRILWKFKDNGWFKYAKGIIFGRMPEEKSYYDLTLSDVFNYSLKDLNVPIIYNADIGHVSPRFTIINGAIAEVTSKSGKGRIIYKLD